LAQNWLLVVAEESAEQNVYRRAWLQKESSKGHNQAALILHVIYINTSSLETKAVSNSILVPTIITCTSTINVLATLLSKLPLKSATGFEGSLRTRHIIIHGHNNLQTLLLEVVSESFGTMTTRDQRSYASTSQSGHPIQQF
jgi:hypothetical protein